MVKKALILMGLMMITASGNASAEIEFNQIADAIYYAEGGKKASTPYGVHYKGCSWETKPYCRKICINTIRNKYATWLKINKKRPNSEFISYLGSKYAPLSDSPLNANWEANVKWFLNHPKEVIYV